MAEFKFPCSRCGQHIQLDELWVGHWIRCPVCNEELVVAQPQSALPLAAGSAPEIPSPPPPIESGTPPAKANWVGVIAVFDIRRHGWKGIFALAVVGIIISSLILFNVITRGAASGHSKQLVALTKAGRYQEAIQGHYPQAEAIESTRKSSSAVRPNAPPESQPAYLTPERKKQNLLRSD